ncbi:MAG: FtsX-like permease family protein, partial [Streptosporangiaceae bacterium]
LRTTVLPVGVAAAAVALLVVAAAASYWVDRRRQEIDLLVSRGISPVALALKAILETAPAVLVGGALGWIASIGLVRTVGPSPLIETASVTRALGYTGLAVAMALAVVAAVSGLRCRDLAERPRGARRGWPAYVPWEVAVLAAGGGVLAWTLPHGTASGQVGTGTVAHVNPAVLVFPLLFLAGAIALVARFGVIVVRRLSRAGNHWPNSLYLAAQRIAGAPAAALLMLAAAGLPAGVFLYGAAATASVQRTLDAEAHLMTGSDVVATLEHPAPELTRRFPGHATGVERLNRQHLNGLLVDILGVDTRTFADGAFWDEGLAGRPLTGLLDRIGTRPPRTPLPVLVSGAERGPATVTIVNDQGEDVDVPVRVVGAPDYFPGQRTGYQVVVMDRRVLAHYTSQANPELWVSGDEGTIEVALEDADAPVTHASYASDVLASSVDEPVTFTFEYLTALAMFTAAVGLGGMLLYLESRTRTRRVAYVLARRMGLSRLAHLASILAELGSVLGAGLIAGSALAVAALRVVAPGLDVDPAPPAALLATPWVAFAIAAVCVCGVIVLASLAVQWSSDRVSPAGVLRTPG